MVVERYTTAQSTDQDGFWFFGINSVKIAGHRVAVAIGAQPDAVNGAANAGQIHNGHIQFTDQIKLTCLRVGPEQLAGTGGRYQQVAFAGKGHAEVHALIARQGHVGNRLGPAYGHRVAGLDADAQKRVGVVVGAKQLVRLLKGQAFHIDEFTLASVADIVRFTGCTVDAPQGKHDAVVFKLPARMEI